MTSIAAASAAAIVPADVRTGVFQRVDSAYSIFAGPVETPPPGGVAYQCARAWLVRNHSDIVHASSVTAVALCTASVEGLVTDQFSAGTDVYFN